MNRPDRTSRPSFDEALEIIRRHVPSLGSESIALNAAMSRITAELVFAASDYPRFDASAMDGFGVRAADIRMASPSDPVVLSISAAARAGFSALPLHAGSVCRISTGAPIPHGCDAVVPAEEAKADNGRVSFDGPIRPGRNVRRQGEDARRGEQVLDYGTILTPEAIGALACYGLDRVQVRIRPRIAVIPTGNELLEKPSDRAPRAIFDSNSVMISAMANHLGLPATVHAPTGDDVAQLERSISAAGLGASIVVTTGGAAGGDHDHLHESLDKLGARIYFHGVRMRPGKPVLFASLPNGAIVLGFPGNPVAALLGARFFLTAACRQMLGRSDEEAEIAKVVIPPKAGTALFLKARRSLSADGSPTLEILEDQRSHKLRPLLSANCWAVVDEASDGSPRCRTYPLAACI